ncbi:MAG: phosphoribosylglycinamide formyltransferase [Myxococcota bacterium]|nr:phosphoribosylglycinamide formyltransferase [Myxococcota bacterium]
MNPERFAVLISGRGSNLKAILDYWETQDPGSHTQRSTPALVISNRPEAPGLQFARDRGLPHVVVDHTQYQEREHFDDALTTCLEEHDISWVILAGFMRVLGPGFVSRYSGRILNTHPSLLPAFPGRDAMGQALAAGVKISGCTVHRVDGGVDTGPIVAQAAVPVYPDDDDKRLGERIRSAEHHLYPRVIAQVIAEALP